MGSLFSVGTKVYSRDGSLVGVTTGGQYHCRLTGCNGLRVAVRWPDGKVTHPCSKGIIACNGHWQIG